jgi:mannitol/fructose-specific phosphotransferase system IIA component (Ntr-type)
MLHEVFDPQTIKLNLEAKTKDAAFEELIGMIAAAHPELNGEHILAAIQDRESKLNTAIGFGIAVPHGYYQGPCDVFGAIGVSPGGIECDAMDGKPVHVFFLMIMGEATREKHLRILNRISLLIKSEALPHIRKAQKPEEVYDLLSRL